MTKKCYVCFEVPHDAECIDLCAPCPCGEGMIEMTDRDKKVMRHSGAGPAAARTHRMPAKAYTCKVSAHVFTTR